MQYKAACSDFTLNPTYVIVFVFLTNHLANAKHCVPDEPTVTLLDYAIRKLTN
jgi:hypothetical protein